ncbi:O-fucosyltransferase family protein [Rubripirellula reticaptiva]|uniref:Glycosyl transferase family 11 n=1 Tax=Rubripirellula reticaptiva TaxID=2528013 RepID=A0A5C6FA06_9BACT|nr:hypothetical protein [Rubripirellula reticaptiva]TWU57692.1 hypothetical protein Poly59_06000 [Rubripirellula reticaptiva]
MKMSILCVLERKCAVDAKAGVLQSRSQTALRTISVAVFPGSLLPSPTSASTAPETSMIVIARNFGQLGNRLLLSANLIAAAREHGVQLLNPSFAGYAQYFESTANDLWCRFPVAESANQASGPPSPALRTTLYKAVYLSGRTLSHLRMTKFPFHIIRITDEQRYDLRSPEFIRKAQGRRPVLVSGWKFDAGKLLHKHADTVRQFYRIRTEHQQRIDELMRRVRAQGNHVVGVHIRQGDYAKFQNGRYFYSIDQYVAAMKRIRNQFSDRQVVFLVCGNVPLGDKDFGDLNVCLGTGQIIEDMYSLAACDTLVGPPSTYTGWASFYGRVPFRWMESVDEAFNVIDPPYLVGADNAQPMACAA